MKLSRSRLEERLVSGVPHVLIAQLSRGRSSLRRRRAKQRVAPLITKHFPTALRWDVLVGFDDSVVVRVGLADEDLILKVAFSSKASARIEGEAAALAELAGFAELQAHQTVLAKVLESGTYEGNFWFTQTYIPGDVGSIVDVDAGALNAAAATAIEPFHAATSQVVAVGPDILELLISEPVAAIGRCRPNLVNGLAELEAVAIDLFAEKRLAVARLHGDFAPTNVLWDPSATAVSGIIDWSFSRNLMPPEVDLVHFCLSLSSLRNRREYGITASALLQGTADPTETNTMTEMLARGPNDLGVHEAVAIAWLQHISIGLQKADDLRDNPVWLSANIDSVVVGYRSTPR